MFTVKILNSTTRDFSNRCSAIAGILINYSLLLVHLPPYFRKIICKVLLTLLTVMVNTLSMRKLFSA